MVPAILAEDPALAGPRWRVLRRRLETELDTEELDRLLRAGGRRTVQEAVDIGRASLTDYLAEQVGE